LSIISSNHFRDVKKMVTVWELGLRGVVDGPGVSPSGLCAQRAQGPGLYQWYCNKKFLVAQARNWVPYRSMLCVCRTKSMDMSKQSIAGYFIFSWVSSQSWQNL